MNVRHVATIVRRELAAYFDSAIAYIFLIVFILISVGLFITEFFIAGRADMRSYFNVLPIILCAFLPALTMRLWAEDRRGNTLELLLTFPMRAHELVVGKYLASFLCFLLSLATTLTIPVMLLFLGRPDFGPIIGSYIGSILLGSFFLALGLFISGLCRDQIVAFISSFVICFLFVLIGTDFVAATLDGWLQGLGLGTFLKSTFGLLPHYGGFAKGVFDVRDLLYFLLGTAIFLVLNGFWLEGRMRPKAKTIFGTATGVSLGIFLLFNWLIADISLGRFDLTEKKIYTVSSTAKKILAGLKVAPLVKFYISPQDKMPTQMKTLEQEVVDKLEEFKIAAKGKFDYKVFHMEAANIDGGRGKKSGEKPEAMSLEEQMEKKGIEPFRVQSIEADQLGVRLVYSAMTIAYKEKPEEIIPQVIPTNIDELEYLLMSKIYRMTLDKTPRVALVAPYEEKMMDPNMANLLAQLGGGKIPDQYKEDEYRYLPAALEYSGYQLDRIRLTKDEPIPAETSTLVLINPKNMDERQLYEVNRFLHEGGSVLMGIQNYNYDYKPVGRGGIRVQIMPENPNVNPMFEKWGLGVDEQILMDEQSEVIQMSGAMQMGPFALAVPVKTPLQIVIAQDGMNQNISVTSNLSPIFYLWGSALTLNEQKLKELNLTTEVLLRSSSHSWKVPSGRGVLLTGDFAIPDSGFGGPYPVAAMVKGQFPNNFQDRKTLPLWPDDRRPEGEGAQAPSEEDLAKKATPAPALTPKPGNLILIGASTLFKENLMAGGGGHLNFFLNAVDAVTLSEDLTKIRSKQEINRRIRRVAPAENIMWRFFTLFFVPIILAAVGSARFLLRRQAKQNYLKSLA